MTCEDVFDLAPRTLVPLRGCVGMTIRVLRGRVWVTEEGDPRDVFLGSGSEHAIGSGGIVLIEGLSLARIALEPVGSPRVPDLRPPRSLASLISSLRRPRVRPTVASGAA